MRKWACFFASLILVASGLAEEPFVFEKAPGQLPKDVVPTRYRISLRPDFETLALAGTVDIHLDVRRPVDRLVLNAQGLAITRAELGGVALKPIVDDAAGTLTVPLEKTLEPGECDLHLEYTGTIGRQPNGLYCVDYKDAAGDARLMVTQMEPADARRMVPCWDEPAFRASFELEVAVPEKFTAVSNMPVAEGKAGEPGAKTVRFKPTPPMASYLLALAIGRFDVLRGEVGGISLGIYTPLGRRDEARYAMEATKKIVPFYSAYFGVGFPLPKLDQIAIPDKGGAMENWGLITYAENLLLFEERASSQATKERVFSVIAHEIAHQWFGNLVTMAWWNNLWLNEGFASWMGTNATDHFNPDWDVWVRSNGGREGAMGLDAQKTTHPIQQTVGTVSQALDMFDAISYQKGQAFIRMLEAYLGPETFRDGLRRYMAAHAWSNTTTADLWLALEQASDRPVREIAAGWTERPGFPVLSLGTDAAGKLTMTQQRFTTGFDAKDAAPWAVPFTVAQAGGGWSESGLMKGEAAVLDAPAAPLNANPGGIGYYRVSYSPALAKRLVQAIPKLSTADRLNFLGDSWAMFVAGRAPLADTFAMIEALKDDPTLPVADRVARTLDAIDSQLRGDEARGAFRKYAIGLVRPNFDRLGWDPQPGETEQDALLRGAFIEHLGKWGDPEVVAEARRRFEAFRKNPDTLAPDLRPAVTKIAGREAGAEDYEALLDLGRNAPGMEAGRMYFSALSAARDPQLAQRTLALALDGSLPPGTATRMIGWVADDGEHAALAWRFADAHFGEIDGLLGSLWSNDYFPKLARALTDADAQAQLRAFAKRHLGADEAAAVERACADMAIQADLRERIGEQVRDALD